MGSGTAQAAGILSTSGIKQVTSVGATASYAKLLEAVRKPLESNLSLDVATLVAIMSLPVGTPLKRLKVASQTI